MRNRLCVILTVLLSCVSASRAFAQASQASQASQTSQAAQTPAADRAAVTATVQRLFDAMLARDTASLRSLLLPGTRFVVIRSDSTAPKPVTQADTTFIRSLSAGTQKLHERMWNPSVTVDGPIAIVWTRYDFHIDDKFSHCGIDTFMLSRTPDGWKINALAYTVQRNGCPTPPAESR